MSADMEQRLQGLEEAQSHHGQMIDDLSDMVTKQWARIEALEAELRRTKDRIGSLENESDEGPEANQKPPHW